MLFVVSADRYNYQPPFLVNTPLSFRLTTTITNQPLHAYSLQHAFCLFDRPLQLPTNRSKPFLINTPFFINMPFLVDVPFLIGTPFVVQPTATITNRPLHAFSC
jgi:hypothetical protein